MGTPQFACPTLEKLIKDPNFEIVAVYTRQPKISGRGHKVTNSPIHQLALQHNLTVITPKTLKNKEIQQEFSNFKADAAVVVAYGLILPLEILQGTKLGCFNIHPSLLPKWRGASPIQSPILNGDDETGITIIKMDEGLDSGDMIMQHKIALHNQETYKKLANDLAIMGSDLLVKTLNLVKTGQFKSIKQDNTKAIYAHKITKEQCQINWQNNNAITIERQIRALNGSLGAYFMHNNEKIKIFEAKIIDNSSKNHPTGTIINKDFHIQCQTGIIQPTIIQRQGKRAMPLKDFLLGFKKLDSVLS